MPRVVVDVMLKPEILDPQGKAVHGALTRLGLAGLTDVRQGKQFVLDLDGELDDARWEVIDKLAAELLSNPVIEDYTLLLVDDDECCGGDSDCCSPRSEVVADEKAAEGGCCGGGGCACSSGTNDSAADDADNPLKVVR